MNTPPIITSSGSTSTWTPCQWCGNVQHTGVCPRVKAIEYHPNGTIKRVEFQGWPSPARTAAINVSVRKGSTE